MLALRHGKVVSEQNWGCFESFEQLCLLQGLWAESFDDSSAASEPLWLLLGDFCLEERNWHCSEGPLVLYRGKY